MTYQEIKKDALSIYEGFNTAYEYPDAYVFSYNPPASSEGDDEIIIAESGGKGSPLAFFKDGSGTMQYPAYIDQLDFDPDEVDEEKGLGVLLDFETGEPA